MEIKKLSKYYLGAAFVLGMMILGGSLILMVSNLKSYDRCVTVKGLCEKEVMADKVIWPIIYKQGGNELGTLYNTVQEMNRTIIDFLKEAGVTDDEITVNAPSILIPEPICMGSGMLIITSLQQVSQCVAIR